MILVVDHYDSFTYNLVQLIESLGHETEVVKSDAEPAAALVGAGARCRDPVARSGPSRSGGVLHRSCSTCCLPQTPVLGVCLGHQAIGVEYGGMVERTAPVHGKASPVFHDGGGIFEGVHDPFEAGRYHSLVVERDDLPADLELTAWTEDGLVMGTRHRELPRYGVQFHPESILTPEGPTIVGQLPGPRAVGSGASDRPGGASPWSRRRRLRARDRPLRPEGPLDHLRPVVATPLRAANGTYAPW